MKHDTKAQYQPRESYSSVHPVLILGIAIFIIPYIFQAFADINATVSTILQSMGIFIILIGGALSIFKASN